METLLAEQVKNMMTKQGWITRKKNGNGNAWNKGLRGVLTAWNKGVPMSSEAKEKLSKTNKGKKHNDALKDYQERFGSWNKGLLGKNATNWKGGITPLNIIERKKFAYTVRKLVLERDGKKCTICGSDKKLQVDHIQPWSEYVEGRFDINNCRTLCMGCHYQITFGRKMPDNLVWGHKKTFITRRTT